LNLCKSKLLSQQQPRAEVRKYCEQKFSTCNQRHASRENIRDVLNSLQEGSAITLNFVASLKGKKGKSVEQIKTHMTIGANNLLSAGHNTVMKVKTKFETPYIPKPYVLDLKTIININHPSVKWDKDIMLLEDLTAKIGVKADFGEIGDTTKHTVALDILALQSLEQKQYAQSSTSAIACSKDIASGLKLTENCKQSRHSAASLDTVQGTLILPSEFYQNNLVETAAEMVKSFLSPYSTVKILPLLAQPIDLLKMEVGAKTDPTGEVLSVDIKSKTEETAATNIPLGSIFEGLLPICTKDSLFYRLLRKITKHGAPSSCSIESGKVTTFDNVKYDYSLNTCEHVIFKDCSPSQKVAVLLRKSQTMQHVKVVIDNNVYEVEVGKPARTMRSAIITLVVNGNTKPIRKDVNTKSTMMSLDMNTHMKMYADGVVEITSTKYGMSVFADSQSVEVRTFQHVLRNRACGLCGDLNDEQTNDVKSAGQCIMSSPALAAYSYMLVDEQCDGIPTDKQRLYNKEVSTCQKKTVIPTKVTTIFEKQAITL